MAKILPPADDDFSHNVEDTKLVEAGQAAWSRLQRYPLWADWTVTAKAIGVDQAWAIAVSGNKLPRKQFGKWLDRNGFRGINSSYRAALVTISKHFDEIVAWRANYPRRAPRSFE
jgi:hypothetical protein